MSKSREHLREDGDATLQVTAADRQRGHDADHVGSGGENEQAPFPQCHASTIAQAANGLVGAWFGGTREKNPDVGIWLGRHIDGKWTAPVEVANGIDGEKRYPCWNPVLFQPSKGDHWIFSGPTPSSFNGYTKDHADLLVRYMFQFTPDELNRLRSSAGSGAAR